MKQIADRPFTVTAMHKGPKSGLELEAWRILREASGGRQLLPEVVEGVAKKNRNRFAGGRVYHEATEPNAASSAVSVATATQEPGAASSPQVSIDFWLEASVAQASEDANDMEADYDADN